MEENKLMAIIASTQQGPPKFTGCVSPANTSALLVTKANASALGSFNSISYLDGVTVGGGGFVFNYIPIDRNIRMTNNGILKTLATVQSDNGVSDPTAGPLNQAIVQCNAYQCDVKRPNCECTTLNNFYVYKSNAINAAGWVKEFTFSDGYVIELGIMAMVLRIGADGLEFVTLNALSVGDWVCSCQSPGRTSDITTGCVQITGITVAAIQPNTVFAALPETSWPQDKFSASEIRASIMLENGVYLFTIPNNGTYV